MAKKRIPKINSLEWLEWKFPTEDWRGSCSSGSSPDTFELRYRDFVDQIGDLMRRAVGRQVRRSQIGGLEWPSPIALGYAAAPSAARAEAQ